MGISAKCGKRQARIEVRPAEIPAEVRGQPETSEYFGDQGSHSVGQLAPRTTELWQAEVDFVERHDATRSHEAGHLVQSRGWIRLIQQDVAADDSINLLGGGESLKVCGLKRNPRGAALFHGVLPGKAQGHRVAIRPQHATAKPDERSQPSAVRRCAVGCGFGIERAEQFLREVIRGNGALLHELEMETLYREAGPQ